MNKPAYITDADIVAGCSSGDNAAWRMFLQRYTTYIDRQIIRMFHVLDFQYGEDDCDSARNAVLDVLLEPAKMDGLVNPERFKAWLGQIARNKARDIVRLWRTKKNSAAAAARKGMLSLQQRTGCSDSDTLLEDCIAAEAPAPDCCGDGDLFAAVQTAIESLEWIYQSPLKISLIFHADFLRESDIDRIADERSMSPGLVRAELSRLLDDLLSKHAATIRHEAAIRVAAAYVERLKARCHVLTGPCCEYAEDAGNEQQELAKNEKRLAALLSGKNRPVTPANAQIANLLGLKENVVATRMFRARKALEQHLLT